MDTTIRQLLASDVPALATFAESCFREAYEGSPRARAFHRRWGFTDFGPYSLVCEGIVLPHRALGRNL
jgi:hypothetical protein